MKGDSSFEPSRNPPGLRGSTALPEHYSRYEMSRVETLLGFLIGAALWIGIGLVFYGNVWVSLVLMGLGAFYVPIHRRMLCLKRQDKLRLQFKDMLLSLSSALSAGKSVVNGLQETLYDIRRMEGGMETLMTRELENILFLVRNGVSVEEAFRLFAERSDIDDIRSFADVFPICTRSGGNLIDVIRRSSQWISEKLEIEQEIAVTLAQKRWEANVLSGMPFLLIALLRVSSPDYMQPLYNGSGRLIMTAGLGLLLAAVWLTRRLMRIEI